ncbi:MAG: TetR/AcrR family transcriptional regulator C-terminal domain-containing protein [Lachnospiraceae bacterium]|nr:TetR/AcrR family transcriptional regulator C-terminal domain-containing protein [Lachnospiraceae bacterium]
MRKRKEYRSSIRSKEWIRKAFMELLSEKDFKKITVTDIVNHADINRSTFYVHYSDIFALVDEIENEIIDRSITLISEIKYESIFQNPTPFLKALTEPLKVNQELYNLLLHTDFAQRKLERIKDIFVELSLNSPEVPDDLRSSKLFIVRINFFIGGIINTYQQWMQGKLGCTLDEITEEIAALFISSAKDIIEKDWSTKYETDLNHGRTQL